jgi:hypothetical protein
MALVSIITSLSPTLVGVLTSSSFMLEAGPASCKLNTFMLVMVEYKDVFVEKVDELSINEELGT